MNKANKVVISAKHNGIGGGMPKIQQKFTNADNTLILMDNQAYAAVFAKTYSKGMFLIERASAYIDGPGKRLLHDLDESSLYLYTCEAGAISTRLMQIASWLLLFRAWLEKDMPIQRIKDEKAKISLLTPSQYKTNLLWSKMPEAFKILVEDSLVLEAQLRNLDKLVSQAFDGGEHDNSVHEQQRRLCASFNEAVD